MGEIIYNKLVRDHIPQIIKNDGQTPITRTLNIDEYKKALLDKLVEESKELQESGGDIGERADIGEVLRAIDAIFGLDSDAIELERTKKSNKRGGFEKRIFLENVQTND